MQAAGLQSFVQRAAAIGAAICAWLLLQPVTGSIADVAASIFGLFYLGFLPSHWLALRSFSADGPRHGLRCSSGLAITFSTCLMIVACISGLGVGHAWGGIRCRRFLQAKPWRVPSVV